MRLTVSDGVNSTISTPITISAGESTDRDDPLTGRRRLLPGGRRDLVQRHRDRSRGRNVAGERVHLEHRLPARRPRPSRHTGDRREERDVHDSDDRPRLQRQHPLPHHAHGDRLERPHRHEVGHHLAHEGEPVVQHGARGPDALSRRHREDDAVRLRHVGRLQPHHRCTKPELPEARRTRSRRGPTAAPSSTRSSCRAPTSPTRRPTPSRTSRDTGLRPSELGDTADQPDHHVRALHGSSDRRETSTSWPSAGTTTTSTITSVTDSAGNVYQLAAPITRGAGLSQAIYYAKNINAAAAGANTRHRHVLGRGAMRLTSESRSTAVSIRSTRWMPRHRPRGLGARRAAETSPRPAPNELIFGAGMTTGAFTGGATGFTTRVITPDRRRHRRRPQRDGHRHLHRRRGAGGSAQWVMQGVTFRAATVPTAPRSVTALPGNTQANVSWTAPLSNGDSPITGYVVTPYLAGTAQATRVFNSTATTQVIGGLTNTKSYTFKVAAKNAVGTSPQSVASPAILVALPTAPTNIYCGRFFRSCGRQLDSAEQQRRFTDHGLRGHAVQGGSCTSATAVRVDRTH